MNYKEKLEERRQRKEAQAFFNQHNDAVLKPIDWAKIVGFGVITSIIGGFVLAYINDSLGFRVGILSAVVGYFVGAVCLRYARYGSIKIAITAIIIYIIGIVIGTSLFGVISLTRFGLSLSFLFQTGTFVECVKVTLSGIFGSAFTIISYAFGAGAAYIVAKD